MEVCIEQVLAINNAFAQYAGMRKKNRERNLKEIAILEQKKRKNTLLLAKLMKKKERKVVVRNYWVYPEMLLNNSGKFWENVVPLYSDERFFQKFRMSRACFNQLCDALKPYIERKDTNFRSAIPIGKRIAVAITILKGNVDYWTIADLFGIGKSTVGYLLHEFCGAVIIHYHHLIKFPKTEEERGIIARGFWDKWQFYDCFGSMDGVHIPIIPPSDQVFDYYNYKGFYSINVLAVVDDKYRFMYIVNGTPGRCNDPSILRKSKLFQDFDSTKTMKPKMTTNYHLISDAAFPLLSWLMKPFPEVVEMPIMNKNFNYRLSRARMVVENAFGRLKARWRILSRRPDVQLDTMRHIIKACMILHNFCENCGEEVPEECVSCVAEEEEYFIENILIPITNKDKNNLLPVHDNDYDNINNFEECVDAKLKRFKLSERLFKDGLSISVDNKQ